MQPDAHPAGGDLRVTFAKALRAVIAEAWPEAAANGVYRASQLTRVPLERLALKTPFVAFSTAFRDDDQWGLTNRSRSGPVVAFYVTDDGNHPEDDLQPKLETLRALLWPDIGDPVTLAVGQVLSDPEVSTSEDLPLNRHFQAQQKPFLAGAVTAEILLSETL